MYSIQTEKGYLIRLFTGEKIGEQLMKFCSKHNIHAGVFQGIGTVQKAEIGSFSRHTKAYQWKSLHEDLEIVSMTGNISFVDGKPFLHIHTVLSDAQLMCFGGHLKEGVVGATCEIFLTDLETENITRESDEETGLKLLSFSGSKK